MLVFFFAIAIAPVLVLISVWRLKAAKELSRSKRRLWIAVCVTSSLPTLGIAALTLLFIAGSYPFKSGIVAVASAPGGEEVCIVQTYKGAEPYQVSLYARKPGGPWVWHYLEHQDFHWQDCRIEFVGTEMRIYEGGDLRRTLSLAEATTPLPHDSGDDLPSNYTPEQILQHHNEEFRQ
jgi:hypothetical protein